MNSKDHKIKRSKMNSKDHKAVPPGEEHLGPPLRPVCGAVECANGALSGMLTEILAVVGDKAEDEDFNCLSNEELTRGT